MYNIVAVINVKCKHVKCDCIVGMGIECSINVNYDGKCGSAVGLCLVVNDQCEHHTSPYESVGCGCCRTAAPWFFVCREGNELVVCIAPA